MFRELLLSSLQQGQDIEDFEHDQMEALYQEARASDSSLTEWRMPCSCGRAAVVGTVIHNA